VSRFELVSGSKNVLRENSDIGLVHFARSLELKIKMIEKEENIRKSRF
jgi:hypothetical protein